MGREIIIKDPDGELEFDGEEEVEDKDDVLQRDWENSSYSF